MAETDLPFEQPSRGLEVVSQRVCSERTILADSVEVEVDRGIDETGERLPFVPLSVPNPATTVMSGRVDPGASLINAMPAARPTPTAGSVITEATGRNP
jgi:hypothetical protein